MRGSLRVLRARAQLLALGFILVACPGRTTETTTESTTPTNNNPFANAGPPPVGRLPGDVRPERYQLALEIVPERDRFGGTAFIQIALAAPKQVVFLHGQGLNVGRVTVQPEGGPEIPGAWSQVNEDGLAAIGLPQPIGPGRAVVRIAYDAPFDRQLKGLFRVDEGTEHYAFTQFEPISARLAFPCFDEPAFKTPYEITLTVRADHTAIASTLPAEEQPLPGGMKRIRYATTPPLPSYLVAFAVGPLDVVDAPPIPPNAVRRRPLPFRGVAAKGRGQQLAYALDHTPAIVESLERYFGIEYPYEKLDIIAVPDFGGGAMENVGAITFREWLLLVDRTNAPEEQRRAFAYVMAHELSHQWFGNLVTMPWWDDIWLNESFATWMAGRIVTERYPAYNAPLDMLSSELGAMNADSLASARQIRQPIESVHDIRNAFDSITYQKGGGVLTMFEQWIGRDVFQRGIQQYLEGHRYASATYEDLIRSISQAAQRDVGPPMRSFLMQPGVPLVAAELVCEGTTARVNLRQSRYLPVGTTGRREETWHVPVCVRYGVGRDARQTCSLLTSAEGRIDLPGEGCPTWVMPNADANGYYRWTLATADLDKLRRTGWRSLTPRERLSTADSLNASFAAASMPAADVLSMMTAFATDSARPVATAPMGLLRFSNDYVADDAMRAKVQAFSQRLYAPAMRRLGWTPRRNEDGETKLIRSEVIEFLAMTVRDVVVRREGARRGRAYIGFGGDGQLHPDAVAPELADVALAVAVQDGDAALFEAVLAHLERTQDAEVRGRILRALASSLDEGLSARARDLALDPRLRVSEVMTPLRVQLNQRELREAAWEWIKRHFQQLVARISPTNAGYLPFSASGFCDTVHAADVERFFAPFIDRLSGGPRNLAEALEQIRLCAARLEAQREGVRAYFDRQPAGTTRGERGAAAPAPPAPP